MANEIKSLYGATTSMTITLASLASSTAGVGRQSDIVDNTTTRYSALLIFVQVKLGTSPTSNRGVYVHLIRGDNDGGSTIRSDGAGTSDAALTVLNAQQIGGLQDSSSASTGDVLTGEFLVLEPGPQWGIAIHQDTGVAFNATGSNFIVKYIGINPEVQ